MHKILVFAAAFLIAIGLHGQTIQPILQPHQTFVDGSGAPCTGCSLFSYAAGTTTPLATYTDVSGGTTNTNPLILDVAGGGQIWLGSSSYKFILKDTLGQTIWTVDNVSPPVTISNLGGPFLPLAGGTLTGALKSSSTINGAWAVNCLGSEDTAQFTSVATAAGAAASAANIQTITVSGNCVVGGQVALPANVHWQSAGATITVPTQTGSCHYTFLATDADNVAVDGFTFIVTTSPGGDNACYNVVQWIDSGGDATAHAHVYIRNNTIINPVWGIYVQYAHGSGSLTDVDISGNTISSPSVYTNGDGIHVDGRVSNITIARNRIKNRNDAGIGLTTNGSYILSGFNVSHNVLLEDRVGLDSAGAINGEWADNYVSATTACSSCQNPAFRQIYFTGYPTGNHTHGNYFNSGANGGSSATVKIDPAQTTEGSWPNLYSSFENNQIDGPNAPLYVRGNGISVTGNTFLTGGAFTLDYDGTNSVATANVAIGSNKWMANGSLVAGAGCALYSNVSLAPQVTLGTLTYTNLACLGTQTFLTPGDLNIGSGNLISSGSVFATVLPGSGAATDFLVRDPTHAVNHLIVDSAGNLNIPVGWIATAQYFKMGGGGAGGLRNASGVTVIPGDAIAPHGSSGVHVQMSDGTGTSGNCAQFGIDGSVTDAGAPCGGGGGAGVTSIDTQTGAFTFGGAGVSHIGNAYTFSSGGTGTVTSAALTVPSWLTVGGSPITTSGTFAVTATSGQTANQFLATPNGSTGAVGLRAIVAADVPTLNQNTSGTAAGLTGNPNASVTNLTILGTCTGCPGSGGAVTATSVTVSGFIATNAEFSLSTCTTAKTIDPANGNRQKVTLTDTDTCALTFTQPAAGTATVQIKVTQSAAGAFSGGVSGCKWPGGAVPTITQTSGAVDMISAYLDGTTAYCQIAQAFN